MSDQLTEFQRKWNDAMQRLASVTWRELFNPGSLEREKRAMTQPETSGEGQQRGSAPQGHADGQRDELRQRLTETLEIHQIEWIDDDDGFICGCDERGELGHMPFLSDAWHHQVNAVLAVLDEELGRLRELRVRAERERDEWDGNASDAEARAETAEAKCDQWKYRCQTAETVLEQAVDARIAAEAKLARIWATHEPVENLQDKLVEVRTHVDRLDEWCRDGHASATIAGSIVADMRKTLDGKQ